MKRFITRSAIVAVLAVLGLGLFTTNASAQVFYRRFQSPQYNNPSFVPTQLQASAFRQWAYQTAVVGRVYSNNYAPWLFGYNPYPPVNYGPVYQYPTYPTYPVYPTYPSYPATGYTPYVSPYATPYSNPYVNPYSGYTSPYGY
jgi:hypothetical protein